MEIPSFFINPFLNNYLMNRALQVDALCVFHCRTCISNPDGFGSVFMGDFGFYLVKIDYTYDCIHKF